MSESVRRLKANRVLEGKSCAACGRAIGFGEDVAVCGACEAVHDASCWDSRGGCSTAGCVNAPLERLAEPVAPRAAPAVGKIECPHCGKLIRSSSTICPHCKQVPTPDGVYRGRTMDAPGATAALVCGIIGFFVCGVILGVIAIVQANQAKAKIASDPRYTGQGKATAGLVLGIIDIVAWAIIIVARLASRDGF